MKNARSGAAQVVSMNKNYEPQRFLLPITPGESQDKAETLVCTLTCNLSVYQTLCKLTLFLTRLERM